MYSSSNLDNLISSATMLSGMSMHDSIALMVMPMPGISSFLFLSLLCLDSQLAKNSCAPGLHSILMFCNYAYLVSKTVVVKFSGPCSMFVLIIVYFLYWVSSLVKLLPANTISCSAALLWASFLGIHILSLTWRILASHWLLIHMMHIAVFLYCSMPWSHSS